MKRLLAAITVMAACSGAFAAPLLPNIVSHDFDLSAYNSSGIEYNTNGVQPDTLVYGRTEADHEVTAYRPNWPLPPIYPVWQEGPTNPLMFGGDFVLAVQFDASDAPQGPLDVSLTGTGLNTEPGAADLEIWGTVFFSENDFVTGLLLAIDLANVSLYGYSNTATYALEGEGTIVGGAVAQRFDLLQQPGGVRGDLDFVDRPAGFMPAGYNPLSAVSQQVRAGYSAEAGVLIPEPATLGLLIVGLGMLLRRR